jgi:hypothetical protein
MRYVSVLLRLLCQQTQTYYRVVKIRTGLSHLKQNEKMRMLRSNFLYIRPIYMPMRRGRP